MKSIKLKDIQYSIKTIDLFITAVSFEKRCFSLLESLDKEKIKKVWFAYNQNESEFFLENLEIAKRYNKSEFITFSTDEPLISAKNLLNSFKNLSHLENVLIDISTFTHEGLLILFKYIYFFQEKINNLYITYVGVKEYSFNETNIDNKWLSKGTKTIRSVLGYPGLMNPSKKNHLIILFGFEIERTLKLIENFEFDKVSIGIGPEDDSINSNHYLINRKRHIELLNLFPFAETFEFSLTNPFLTKEQLNSQIRKYEGYNVVITPLNNKLSTIGVALSAFENPKVQVCYVRAHEYNYKGYSRPADEGYFMKVF